MQLSMQAAKGTGRCGSNRTCTLPQYCMTTSVQQACRGGSQQLLCMPRLTVDYSTVGCLMSARMVCSLQTIACLCACCTMTVQCAPCGLPPCREGVPPVQVQATAYNYNHQHGTLHLPFSNPGRSPVALAEIAAVGRRFPALSQVQMQAALRAALEGVAADQLPGACGGAPQVPLHELKTLASVQHADSGKRVGCRALAAPFHVAGW